LSVIVLIIGGVVFVVILGVLIAKAMEGERWSKERKWHQEAQEKHLQPQSPPPTKGTDTEQESHSQAVQTEPTPALPKMSKPDLQYRKNCPNCGTPMEPIKLVYAAGRGGHGELTYTDAEATTGFWTGQFPLKGFVRASICESCGQIVFYGLRITGRT
jgi:hypothetical protein